MKTRLLWLVLAAASAASAQSPLTCSSSAGVPRTVRSEGKAEYVNDVVVTCQGGAPTPGDMPILSATFTLAFNAPVASRITGPDNRSEALVLLDEPAPGSQYPCTFGVCPAYGNGIGSGYYSDVDNKNVYEGIVGTASQANTITFYDVPFDPPGSPIRTFRFTNLRLAPGSVSGTALQLLGINVASQVPITSIGGPLTLANKQVGLNLSVRNAASVDAAASGVNLALAPAGSPATRGATLRFAPTFGNATLKRSTAATPNLDTPPPPQAQNTPGSFPGSETGFYNPSFPVTYGGSDLGLAGFANWGTRLMATFENVPPNVTIFVSLRNDGAAVFNAPAARLIATDGDGAGVFTPIAGDGAKAQLVPVSGTARAVWEVIGNSLGGPNNFDLGVFFAYPAGITVAPGPITVKLGYAPQTGGFPSFADAVAKPVLATFSVPAPPPPPPPPPVPVVTVTPTVLTFTGTAGGPNPPAQSVVVNASPGQVSYGMAGGGNLSFVLQPLSGQTPGSTTVTVNTRGLPAGTYTDTLNVFTAQSATPIAVTLTLAAGPTISALTPSTTTAGAPAFTLTVAGANFARGTVVNWNGAPLTTTFVSASQLTAQVGAALVANTGEFPITVVAPDGATSNAVRFAVVPLRLTEISPSVARAGGPAFTLTATGTGFLPGATLNAGGSAVTITNQTATQITATVPASAIAAPGTLEVTVTNPGGARSNALTLTVAEPLTLTRIRPDTVTATGPAFVLTLAGTGFTANATVQIGGASFAPASSSRTQLTVNVPASAIAEAGALTVRVAQGNETSGTQTLTVRPAPRITALSPANVTAGAGAFTLVVTGSNLTAGSTVRLNGQSLATSFGGTESVSAQVPAALVAATGTASITVVTEDGVASNALTFTITAPVSITALSPSSANAGSAAFTLTVTGSNFTQGAQVMWNGQALPTTFVSATQLTAQVAASLVSAVGTASVSVGGSNALTFTIVLPALTNVGFTAPANAPSGQDQTITLTLGGTYPVELRGTLTLTFTPDGGLPNDPAIQFPNGTRTLTFTVPAGAPAQIPAVLVKTGTVAGVITVTLTFTTASGEPVTPAGVTPQRITIARAAPSISSITCVRNASGFTVTIDGYTNTRESTQATFDFTAASGASLGTTQLLLQTGSLFSGWFGSSNASAAGGLFRYTQPFTVQGTTTNVTGLSVRLGNAAGTSATATCQLQ